MKYKFFKLPSKLLSSLRGTQVGGPAAPSASHSSLTSIKEGLHRVIGGTPPPPYEVNISYCYPNLMHDYRLSLLSHLLGKSTSVNLPWHPLRLLPWRIFFILPQQTTGGKLIKRRDQHHHRHGGRQIGHPRQSLHPLYHCVKAASLVMCPPLL